MDTAQGKIDSISKRTKNLVEQAGGPTVSSIVFYNDVIDNQNFYQSLERVLETTKIIKSNTKRCKIDMLYHNCVINDSIDIISIDNILVKLEDMKRNM